MQQALRAPGYYTGKVDGDYGGGTEFAVRSLQRALRLPQTGATDDDTWSGLFHAGIPDLFERCLQLTARIEGHGFTIVKGNFDGAGLTWGLIGFTLKNGEIGALIREVNAQHPGVVQRCFLDRTAELLDVLSRSSQAQVVWADGVSLGARKTGVAEPWRGAFERFGNEEVVQAAQISRACSIYYARARADATRVGLTTELGVALCFDTAVQNGGLGSKRLAAIDRAFAANKPADQLACRLVVAEAVARYASEKWREDVRVRKTAIARGAGVIHGESFDLQRWGLAEVKATND
jgi:hypothetical protein